MLALPRTPFPVTFRELWLPPSINGNATLPTSVEGGHGLTLTGARKGTTADGVHGDGSATSNINCGANAVDNAAVKYWVSLRLRLDQDWTTGGGDQYLWGKFLDATHYIRLKLNSATGNLVFEKDEGGAGFVLSIASPAGDGIWHAGVWYQALCSISNTAGARFKVNDAGLQTDADANPMPNGGDLCFLDFDDPGAGTGFEGVEADIFCGNADLTGQEETNLFRGWPPLAGAGVIHDYPLDEGRGAIAYDRGTGADNGTLDTSCIWSFGQVEQPALSLDGINDLGQSSVGVDISGNITVIYVGKMKATHQTPTVQSKALFSTVVDASNYIIFYNSGAETGIRFMVVVGGATTYILNGLTAAIDEYDILIGTANINGKIQYFLNGYSIGTNTGAGIVPGGAATAYIGSQSGPNLWDVGKVIFATLIEGAFTDKQALAFSRWLANIYNLPISI